jgi:bifunctional non-homologous end joining protein LigD
MRLVRIPEPFDHSDFLFEPKMDGFRAVAHVRGHRCELVSRNGHVFKSWPQLAEEIAHALRASSIDGEICCLDPDGRTNFHKLLFRREWPYFYAFDLLALNGRDLRALSLLERKRRLLSVIPRVESRVLYLDHVRARGLELFAAACARDLERVVGNGRRARIKSDGRCTSWLKIKNPDYSQIVGRHELFERHGAAAHSRSRVVAELRLS